MSELHKYLSRHFYTLTFTDICHCFIQCLPEFFYVFGVQIDAAAFLGASVHLGNGDVFLTVGVFSHIKVVEPGTGTYCLLMFCHFDDVLLMM